MSAVQELFVFRKFLPHGFCVVPYYYQCIKTHFNGDLGDSEHLRIFYSIPKSVLIKNYLNEFHGFLIMYGAIF